MVNVKQTQLNAQQLSELSTGLGLPINKTWFHPWVQTIATSVNFVFEKNDVGDHFHLQVKYV